MTPWRMGYLICPDYNYPYICQLGEYESSLLKRYVVRLADEAILYAMKAG